MKCEPTIERLSDKLKDAAGRAAIRGEREDPPIIAYALSAVNCQPKNSSPFT
jgi:hypothetical protein